MNPALISYFEQQADQVVLTVILNGQTTISRDFMVQTLLETYDLGLQVGTNALSAVETILPAIRAQPAEAPPEPIGSLDGGYLT